jgi:hypothetical protein
MRPEAEKVIERRGYGEKLTSREESARRIPT